MSETIFKREKKERNYTVLDNTFIKDVNLSWKAKGLMTYLLSLPDVWEIRMSEVKNHAKDGKDSLTSAINELKTNGYLVYSKEQNEKGEFTGKVIYSIHEIPVPPEQRNKVKEKNRKTENPKNGKSDLRENRQTENPTLLNTDLKQNTNYLENTKGETSNEVLQPIQPKEEKPKRFIKPTLEEIKEYCKERNNSIDPEHFYDYYESNGWTVGRNKMKDWKATIRNWEKNEKKWNKPKYKNNNPLSRQEEEWSEKLNNMTKEEIDNLF